MPLATSVLVCPHPGSSASTTSTLGLVVPAPVDQTTDPQGRATLTRQKPGADPVIDLDSTGTAGAVTIPKGKTLRTSPAARAPWPRASRRPGHDRHDRARRGLLAVACAAPSGDSWFVGGRRVGGRRTTVLLTNSDSTPAVVDIQVFGPDGPVPARGGEGVLVPARTQTSHSPRRPRTRDGPTALHVVARAGRVSGRGRGHRHQGPDPTGGRLRAAEQPLTRVSCPASRRYEPGPRYLQVVAHRRCRCIVNVHLVADDGTFAPESSAVLEIAAGRSTRSTSPRSSENKAAAVLLESDSRSWPGYARTSSPSARRAEVAYTTGLGGAERRRPSAR